MGDLALVRGASAGFFLGPDFSRAGSEMTQNFGVFEINCLNVFLTKVASHIFHKIRSTKFEYSKQIQIFKFSNILNRFVLKIYYLIFDIVSNFDIRYSDLNLKGDVFHVNVAVFFNDGDVGNGLRRFGFAERGI